MIKLIVSVFNFDVGLYSFLIYFYHNNNCAFRYLFQFIMLPVFRFFVCYQLNKLHCW